MRAAPSDSPTADPGRRRPGAALRLDLRRRRILWAAFRSRRDLTHVSGPVPPPRGGVLAVAVVRNEMGRLPHWLDHHRRLGVRHFLIVDNASDDGGAAWLAAQPDVTLWTTAASYRASRFGRDWTNWLLSRHGAGRWCLTLDADELFGFPHDDRATLDDLTAELDRRRVPALGALMVELFPKGPLLPDSPPDDAAALARADVGIALDGDADRVLIVDEKGQKGNANKAVIAALTAAGTSPRATSSAASRA